MFVGPAPAPIQAVLPLPADAEVVGGLTRESGGTVVFDLDGTAEAALAAYGELVESEGWAPAPDEIGRRGGFQTAPQRISGTWCTETHWLGASAVTFAGESFLRVRFYESEMEPTPCENAERRAQMAIGHYGLSLPVLRPPFGAEVQMSGGGGSTNEVSMTATVITSLSATELFDHYAGQVGRAGWRSMTTTSDNGLAMGRWVARDDDGEPAQGLLAVWPMPDPDTYGAWARMERLRSPR